MSTGIAKFNPGDHIRVRMDDPPGHIRTPFYIRGKVGWVEKVYGEFLNPELLGHAGDGLPKKQLYLVGFYQKKVWNNYEAPSLDRVYVDIFEHWLEPA